MQSRLEKVWIKQLYDDFDTIAWQYGIPLKKPLIEIMNSTRALGKWDPNMRTIKLSASLIMAHDWDVVLQVFKHEIAHQMVTDIFQSDEGHGPYFVRACDMIGLAECFRRASGDLIDAVKHFKSFSIQPENQNILNKVRKLLALAQSKNEHESALAMEKVNALITKYNLKRIGDKKDAAYVYKMICHKKKRLENYQRRICTILSDFYFVEVILTVQFDAKTGDTYRAFELLGTTENVLMAEYVYYFLYHQLDALWKLHQARMKCPGKQKRSYFLGVLKGFYTKLEQQEQKSAPRPPEEAFHAATTSALVCMGDLALQQFKTARYPRLSNYRGAAATVDPSAYEAGIKDGAELNLHKGIGEKNPYQGKMIDY